VHEFGGARNRGRATRELEKDADGGAEGERAAFMAVEKAARLMFARFRC